MVAIDRPPLLTGVLLDVGGTLGPRPALAERMRPALPNALSTQLEMLHEEFTGLAGSIDWSVVVVVVVA